MKFNKMEFDAKIVKHITNRAYLLKAPSDSKYKGYVFWWQSRWIRKSEKPNCRILMFRETDNFEFLLFDNHPIEKPIAINKIIIRAEEFKEIFKDYLI